MNLHTAHYDWCILYMSKCIWVWLPCTSHSHLKNDTIWTYSIHFNKQVLTILLWLAKFCFLLISWALQFLNQVSHLHPWRFYFQETYLISIMAQMCQFWLSTNVNSLQMKKICLTVITLSPIGDMRHFQHAEKEKVDQATMSYSIVKSVRIWLFDSNIWYISMTTFVKYWWPKHEGFWYKLDSGTVSKRVEKTLYQYNI